MPDVHHVVVDGSNLATEGRTTPSLAQLDEAVRAYLIEDPDATIIVVVDATFAHRIDAAERDRFEQAELHGELVSPPAGAIGRGDAFVLRIAERTGAVVLSNDSFQEFHGEHPWLFDPGRLVGGKPIAGVGWIFTPRLPVRGAKSRKATKDTREDAAEELTPPRKAAEVVKALQKAERAAKKTTPKAKAAAKKAPAAEKGGRKKKEEDAPVVSKKAGRARRTVATDAPSETTGGGARRAKKVALPAEAVIAAKAAPRAKKGTATAETSTRAKGAKAKADPVGTSKRAPKKAASAAERQPRVRRAIDEATAEVLSPTPAKPKRERAKAAEPPPAVNDPLAFIRFVAQHPLGSALEGVVVSFTSHGAMVDVALPDSGVLHCYIPLRALGDPAPRKAREVLSRGERRQFVLASLDPPRRMAELSLDGAVGQEPAAGASSRTCATAARTPRSR